MAIRLIKLVKKISASLRPLIQDQTKQKQSSIKLSKNRPNATAWKEDTPEQTKKVIILGDSITKHVRRYDLSHSWQRDPNPPPPLFYGKPSVLPTLPFLNFVQPPLSCFFQPPPALLFLLSCFFG